MRTTHALGLLLAATLAAGCTRGGAGGGGSPSPDGGAAGDGTATLRALSLAPADATLTIAGDAPATARYTVTGTWSDGRTEDVTARATLTLDNPALGTFSGSAFSSDTQRGGTTVVRATVGDVSGETGLTLVLRKQLVDARSPDLPAEPGAQFGGPVEAARQPQLVYPNDGVVLPPNLGQLEVHFRKGAASNTLFELAFTNAITDVRVFLRCTLPGGFTAPADAPDGCIFSPSAEVWRYVAETNRGGQPVQLTLRATGDGGGTVGISAPLSLRFSRADLRGAIYYWTTGANGAVIRYDFAGPADAAPSAVVTTTNSNTFCVGCHALSRDGKKLVAEEGGQHFGKLLLFDLSRGTDSGPTVTTASHTSIFESWNPEGTQFVGVYGDDGATRFNLLLFNGDTAALEGEIAGTGTSAHPADHPDWSADGQTIAYTSVGVPGTLQRMGKGAIMRVQARAGGGWGTPETVVPAVSGRNRYYPSIAPDSSFLVFNESTCPAGKELDTLCNADTDPSATLFAARLEPNATPVPLSRANAGGLMDRGATQLTNSYPRWSPFVTNDGGESGSARLMWVTFSSTRRYGLRSPPPGEDENPRGTLLWMAAVDPDAVAAGKDPSFPAFALPFQELSTSNHIAQWAQYLVKGGCATDGEGCTGADACCNGLQCVSVSGDPPLPCDVGGTCFCKPIPQCAAGGESCSATSPCCEGLRCANADGTSCSGPDCVCRSPCGGVGQACGGGVTCCSGLACLGTSGGACTGADCKCDVILN